MVVERLDPPLSEPLRSDLVALFSEVFGGDPERLSRDVAHLERDRGSVCWIVREGDLLLGFKWATVRRPGALHSNLGLVRPSHRRQGLARALMRAQHAWAEAQGFAAVTSNTYGRFRPMLLLNLEEGFDLTGVQHAERGLKLLLERRLGPIEPLRDVPIEAPAPGRSLEVQGRHALAAAVKRGWSVDGVRRGTDGLLIRLVSDG